MRATDEERTAAEEEARKLLSEAEKLIKRVETLADEFGIPGLDFSPAYGMGGYYNPTWTEGLSLWDKSDYEDLKKAGYYSGYEDGWDNGPGWVSSSSQC